jgi:hypothetical protein
MGERTDRTAGLVRLGDVLVPARVTTDSSADASAPLLTAAYEVRDGRPECVELHITSRPNGRGIRLRDLEELFTLDAACEAAFSRFVIRPDQDWTQAALDATPGLRREAARDVRQARRSRTRRQELARVAQVYREHVDGNPTEAVRLVLSYGSHRTAARRVQEARAAGLLPPTTPGKRKAD